MNTKGHNRQVRETVVEQFKAGCGSMKISQALNISRSTVQAIVLKWKEYQTTEIVPTPGRPSKLSSGRWSRQIRAAATRPMITRDELQRSTAENVVLPAPPVLGTAYVWSQSTTPKTGPTKKRAATFSVAQTGIGHIHQKHKYDPLQQRISMLEVQNQRLLATLRKERNAGRDSQKQLAQCRVQLKEQNSEIQQLLDGGNDLIRENTSLSTKIDTMRAQMCEKDAEIQGLKDRLSDLQTDMAETKGERVKNDQKIKDLELEKKQLTQTTATKQLEVRSRFLKRIKRLNVEVRNEKKAVRDSKKLFAESEAKLMERISEFKQLQDENNDLSLQLKALSAEKIGAKIQEENAEIKRLTDKLSDLQTEMEEIKEERVKNDQKIKDLELEKQLTQTTATKQLEEVRFTFLKRIKRLNVEVRNEKKAVRDSKKLFAESEAKLMETISEFKQLQNDNNHLSVQIKALSAEKIGAKTLEKDAEIQRLTDKLSDLQTEMEEIKEERVNNYQKIKDLLLEKKQLTQTTATKQLEEVTSTFLKRIKRLNVKVRNEKKAVRDSKKLFAESEAKLMERISEIEQLQDDNDLSKKNAEIQCLTDKLSDLQTEMEEIKEERVNNYQKIKDLELEKELMQTTTIKELEVVQVHVQGLIFKLKKEQKAVRDSTRFPSWNHTENPDHESTNRRQEMSRLEEETTNQEAVLEQGENPETEVPTAEPVEPQTGSRTITRSTDGRQTGGVCGLNGFGIAGACLGASTVALLAYWLF